MKGLVLVLALGLTALTSASDDLRTYTSDATCPCGAVGDCTCANCPCPKVSVSNRLAETPAATVPTPRLRAPKLTEQQKTDLLEEYDVYMDSANTEGAKLTAKPRPKAKQSQQLSYQNKTKTLVYEPPLVEVRPTQQWSSAPAPVYSQPMQSGGSAGGNLYAPPTVTYYSTPAPTYSQAPQPSYGSAGGAPQASYGSSGGVPASGYTAYYSAPPVQPYVTAAPNYNQVYVNAAPAPRAVWAPLGGVFRPRASGRVICSGGQCYIR